MANCNPEDITFSTVYDGFEDAYYNLYYRVEINEDGDVEIQLDEESFDYLTISLDDIVRIAERAKAFKKAKDRQKARHEQS